MAPPAPAEAQTDRGGGASSARSPAASLQCMEIWGGYQPVRDSVAMPGIDVWVHSQPHADSEGGGDIHYVSMCGAGAIGRFLLADVSGHGADVARIAHDLRRIMRRHINQLGSARMARELNAEFSGLAEAGRFATALIATYFAPTDQLVIANAGHPRPLWYRARRDQWQILHEDDPACDQTGPRNLPLGVIADTGYHQFAVTLDPGDRLLLYTDALTEARNPAGRLLGETGLLGLVRALDHGHPEQTAEALVAALGQYRGGHASDDDLTFLFLHHNASHPPRQTFGQRVRTLAKMVGLAEI